MSRAVRGAAVLLKESQESMVIVRAELGHVDDARSARP